MSTPAVVAFDLYGTLLDVGGLAGRLTALIGSDAGALLAAWRAAQLERSWELVHQDRYEPFDQVTAATLARVAPGLDEELRARMAATWLSLPPYPDAAAALARLRAASVRVAVLSNGTRRMIEAALAAAALTVDAVLSVDDVRAYKPDPRVYAQLDGLAPREATLFVSANGWDAEGAKRARRAVAWIDRGGEPPAIAPDLVVRSLADLAARVAG